MSIILDSPNIFVRLSMNSFLDKHRQKLIDKDDKTVHIFERLQYYSTECEITLFKTESHRKYVVNYTCKDDTKGTFNFTL